MSVCMFTGGNYDAQPWLEHGCVAEDVPVPAGCPLDIATGVMLDPADITAVRVAMNGTTTPLAATATDTGVDTQTFMLPDVASDDCHLTNITINFHKYKIDVPDAQPGDVIAIQSPQLIGPINFTIGPADACAAPAGPGDYQVVLDCEIAEEPDRSEGWGSCAAGGDPSLGLLVALGVLPLLTRRRRAR
jgi:hypothetical protein